MVLNKCITVAVLFFISQGTALFEVEMYCVNLTAFVTPKQVRTHFKQPTKSYLAKKIVFRIKNHNKRAVS